MTMAITPQYFGGSQTFAEQMKESILETEVQIREFESLGCRVIDANNSATQLTMLAITKKYKPKELSGREEELSERKDDLEETLCYLERDIDKFEKNLSILTDAVTRAMTVFRKAVTRDRKICDDCVW